MFKLNEYVNTQPNIVALSLVSLVVMMGSSMVTPSLTLYAQQDLGANEFLVGAVIAGFAIGRLIFDIPAGVLTDRLGLNRTMILGLAILVGASVLAGLAPNYGVLLFARVLEGIGSSIYVSAAIAFVLLSSDAAKRGTSIGSYQSMLMMGPIIGPVVGAPIAVFFGYNSPYFAFAVMAAAALAIIAALNYRGKFRVAGLVSAQESDMRQARMTVYLNTAAIATFGFAFLRSGIYTTGLPLFAYAGLSLSVFDVGIILTVAAAANLASSFFSGRITQMYGMQKPLFAAILASAALVAVIPLATSMAFLLAIMTLIGVTSGFFGQSIAWAAEQIEEKVRRKQSGRGAALGIHSHVTRGIGFNRMIGDLGLVLGPLFVGYTISAFTGDPLLWFISYGLTSAVLGVVSFLVLGTKVTCNIMPRQK
ncbi:MAG TPA: MFS transporter [Nitrososphaera sp.]|nr:MFS transporter [Nitrososphaera sp.]